MNCKDPIGSGIFNEFPGEVEYFFNMYNISFSLIHLNISFNVLFKYESNYFAYIFRNK